MTDRYKLNETRSPIDPSSWSELNQNWEMIKSYFRFLERNQNLLAGEDVDGIIKGINERITEADIALQQIETDLVQVNGAADNANAMADLAQTAADIAEQITELAQEKVEFIEGHEEDIIFFTSMQNNLQAQVNQLVVSGDSSPEAAQARVDVNDVAHSTLKSRIDNDVVKINQKIDSEIGQVAQQLDEKATKEEVVPYQAIKTDTLDKPKVVKKEVMVSDDFIVPAGIVFTENNELTIDSTYIAHTPLFYREGTNLRGMEVTLVDLGGTSSQNVRFAYGYDKENFALLIPDGGNFIRRAGMTSDVTKSNSGEIGAIETLVANDRLRYTVHGNVVQFFKNDYLIGTYAMQDIAVPNQDVAKFGFTWRIPGAPTKYKGLTLHTNYKKYMHLSIDDVLRCLQEVNENKDTYTSVFDHPTLNFLRQLHIKYGAVFTLYLFYQNTQFNLSQMTAKFKSEFLQNADWLKFGFHALASGVNYSDNTVSVVDAKTHYDNTITQIIRFAGGYSIDRIIRTGYYSGTLDVCKAWRDTAFGVRGFMTADDTRTVNVYLDTQQNRSLKLCDDLLDKVNGFYNVQTDVRLESYADVPAQLDLRLRDYVNHGGNQRLQAVFTHEARIIDNSVQNKLDSACKWAVDNGYAFDFPQNNIPSC